MDADIICPYCGANGTDARCASCGRDVAGTRRICACGRATPAAERSCMHCGLRRRSDLRWKIPLIVALFLAAAAVTIASRIVY